MKKTIALVIALLYIFMIPAFADNEHKSGLFTYTLNGNGTATITGFNWSANGKNDIYIPGMIDGYTVTTIGPSAFSYETRAQNVDNTFSVVVVMPNTIVEIGEKAFWCANISGITITENVQLIGAGAFAGCKSITQFSVASGNTKYATIDGVLYDKTKKEVVAVPMTKKNIKIPDGIVSIGAYAFWGFGYIGYGDVQLSLPDTILEIKESAFEGCSIYSEKVKFSNVEIIGDYAFYRASVHWDSFPKVVSVGDYAFSEGSTGLVHGKVEFPSSLQTIGKSCFENCELSYETTEQTISLSNTLEKERSLAAET